MQRYKLKDNGKSTDFISFHADFAKGEGTTCKTHSLLPVHLFSLPGQGDGRALPTSVFVSPGGRSSPGPSGGRQSPGAQLSAERRDPDQGTDLPAAGTPWGKVPDGTCSPQSQMLGNDGAELRVRSEIARGCRDGGRHARREVPERHRHIQFTAPTASTVILPPQLPKPWSAVTELLLKRQYRSADTHQINIQICLYHQMDNPVMFGFGFKSQITYSAFPWQLRSRQRNSF